MPEHLDEQVTPVRPDLDDELAAALQRGAEQAAKVSIEEMFEQVRQSYVEMTDADDGEAPDVLVLILNNKYLRQHNNGATPERLAWIASSFTNALYGEESRPLD